MFVSYARTVGAAATAGARRLRLARPGELPSREQMDELVRRECCRADRNGHEFCLVVFHPAADPGASRRRLTWATHRLVRAMLRRARTTDVVGWFGEGELCAVLPDTPAAGARVFAHSVCAMIAGRVPRPRAVIYQYPGEAPDEPHAPGGGRLIDGVAHHRLNGDGNGRGNGNGNGHRNGNGRRNGRGHDNGHTHNRLRGLLDGNGNGESDGHTDSDSRGNGNGDSNGNGHSSGNGDGIGNGNGNGNGNGRGNGHTHAEADVNGGCVISERPVRLPQDALMDALSPNAADHPASLGGLMVRPMPRWKRALDVVGAVIGLIVLSPVMAAAAAAILLTGPGPVLFTQRRAGLGGRPFTIFKFRTMTADAERQKAALRPLSERDGPAFKLSRDPRVTPVGRILRQTSIDELPQLWNVLRGEMSLVGPRPLPLDESDECARWQRHRLDVTPGLTCIWQISGRSTVNFAQWVRMDMAYIRRRTLLHDLWILLRTVPAVLLRRGAW